MRPALVALLALCAGAVGGVLSSRALGDAHAQGVATVVVPVPVGGVVFRTSAGNAIARIRGDAAGGVLEILDAREQVAVRLRAGAGGGQLDLAQAQGTAAVGRTVAGDPGY
jgi:hypothetical protein